MLKKDQDHILNTYRRLPIEIEYADKQTLYGKDGKAYLDLFSGIGVNALGHQHPAIMQAIQDQLTKYMHMSNYFVSEPRTLLAELLTKHTFADKVFFTNSGTEAVEAAIKLARKYGKSVHPDKVDIIALHNSFHGRTTGAMTLTGNPVYKEPFAPLLPNVKHITINDSKALLSISTKFTCAVIVEMLQGEGGIHPLSPEFVNTLKIIQDRDDVIIIVDEIQTGIMRTGTLFSYEQFGLTPDLVTAAKAIGGGLPLGALLVSSRLSVVLKPGDHGTTFGGNPLACAAGHALVKTVLEPEFIQSVKEKSNYLFSQLILIQSRFPDIIKEIRGLGLMVGIDVGTHADYFLNEARNHQILLNVTSKTVIRLLPPLTITFAEIDQFLSVFTQLARHLKEAQSC